MTNNLLGLLTNEWVSERTDEGTVRWLCGETADEWTRYGVCINV